MSGRRITGWVAGLAGLLGVIGYAAAGAQQGVGAPGAGADVKALEREVERLRSLLPAQAVAMTQVAYNFDNLWFAAHAGNWPLAEFYYNETRVRLRWAVRIMPQRKVTSGEVALAPLLERLEDAELTALGEALASRDVAKIEDSYRATLDGCYNCHIASEKPYLRLQVPKAPAEPMIEFGVD